MQCNAIHDWFTFFLVGVPFEVTSAEEVLDAISTFILSVQPGLSNTWTITKLVALVLRACRHVMIMSFTHVICGAINSPGIQDRARTERKVVGQRRREAKGLPIDPDKKTRRNEAKHQGNDIGRGRWALMKTDSSSGRLVVLVAVGRQQVQKSSKPVCFDFHFSLWFFAFINLWVIMIATSSAPRKRPNPPELPASDPILNTH